MANKLGPIAIGYRGAPLRMPDEVVEPPKGPLSAAELELVKKFAEQGMRCGEIAKTLNRRSHVIWGAMKRLGYVYSRPHAATG
jgi:hypothetical protein